MTNHKLEVSRHWPQLKTMLAKGRLAFVDYLLAEHLLRQDPLGDEAVAALLCHLSCAVRAGQLCIQIDHKEVFPNPRHIWLEDQVDDVCDSSFVTEEEWQRLSSLILTGFASLPKYLYATVLPNERSYPTTKLIRYGNKLYFQRYWQDEARCLSEVHKLMQTMPIWTFPSDLIDKRLKELESQGCLLPEQCQGIRQACHNSLSIICGGPGTGKTYTAGHLICIFWELLSPEQRENCNIALAAPTGKAAANLQNSLSRAVSGLEGFPSMKATTLHALLGLRVGMQESQAEGLHADLLIVDECSMIDIQLMVRLLSSLKPGSRLVLLGDRYQLPPVGAGRLFSDLIQALSSSNLVTELRTCLRTELKSIVRFAEVINQGDVQAVQSLLSEKEKGVSRLILPDTTAQVLQQAIVDHTISHFSIEHDQKTPPHKYLEAFNRFRLLSPLRKGPLGVDALNQLLMRQLLQRCRHPGWFFAPIMIAVNEPKLNLTNGEVGVLARRLTDDSRDLSLKQGDYALFPDESSISGARTVPALLLPKFEYAFCLSVHKSQGSEFDHVFLLMPEGAAIFGREVLYTGATRARKQLEIWCSDAVLTATLQNIDK